MGSARSAARTCAAVRSGSEKTATLSIPRSRQARITRRAISPRLAIRMRLNMAARVLQASQWNIAVLARRVVLALVFQRAQRSNQSRAGIARTQYFVHVAQLGGLERIGEGTPVFLGQAGALGDFIGSLLELVAKYDVDRPLGSHYCDFRAGIGEVEIAAQMLGGHHVVGAAVSLACDDRDLGYGGLAIGVQQFGAMLDNSAEFLRGTRQESRHIDKGDQRNIEAIAKTRSEQLSPRRRYPGNRPKPPVDWRPHPPSNRLSGQSQLRYSAHSATEVRRIHLGRPPGG